MNRTAYFTTDLAIKTMSTLLKAKTIFHGLSNIGDGPTIFVINHFTRIETLLLPYYLYHLTKTPVWSLADDSLFKGGLKAYFDLVGVVSTRDPKRDSLIVKTLLTGSAHWIIFPEGRMVKNKKLVRNGSFVIGDDRIARSPHTGAAALALRTEIFRRFLRRDADADPGSGDGLRRFLGLGETEAVSTREVRIVPINLTYYPIRGHDNLFSDLVARYVKEPSERMLEELMTEGSMLLDGVDIDIHFGRPLELAGDLEHPVMNPVLDGPATADFDEKPEVGQYLRHTARKLMHTYMARIYSMTTVNHDHLFSSFLRRRPYRSFEQKSLAREVFLASEYLREERALETNLHLSLADSQVHLLVDDRFGKQGSFIRLALETGCLVRDGRGLKKDLQHWQLPLPFDRARLQNPVEVMANEVEPLPALQKYIRRIGWTPDWLLRLLIARRLYRQDQDNYRSELASVDHRNGPSQPAGRPFLLPARSFETGVVVVHSYLSVPQEMRACAQLLNRQGAWVYGVRLPGHGTSPENLATRKWEDWQEAVERGYALLDGLCRTVFLVGFSAAGSLVLELAARLTSLAGVVAICPPCTLQNYSKLFMPPQHVWDRLLMRWKGNLMSQEFVEYEPENPEINYHRNPVAGVNEIDKLLGVCREQLPQVHHPALVIAADRDRVIGRQAAREVYDLLGSATKELAVVAGERHNVVYGPGSRRTREIVASFVKARRAAAP